MIRKGVRLAIDWGKARVGVAACDRDCLLCYPVETVSSSAKDPEPALRRIAELVSEYDPFELILGWPIDLRGKNGLAVQHMTKVAAMLSQRLSIPIRVVDERLSTATVAKQFEEIGRNTKKRRAVIDQAAAVSILEQALEKERQTGLPAGKLFRIDDPDGS